jgi:uncharacterized protein
MEPSMRHPPNRLAREKSPYLLQHAHNPVDWRPWGAEAFAEAKARDVPVLVSIGYSTCHWCHVMERESFEDPAVAAVMNEHLVSVKVDREERPDVDKLYMTAVQALTGQGGWPLNVFLTPDGSPFIGGTYFPPVDAHGRAGWPTLVRRIGTAWKDAEGRKDLLERGRQLMEGLTRYLSEGSPEAAGDPAQAAPGVDAALASFAASHDPEHGGFSGAPKFPMPVNHHFIFRAAAAGAAGADKVRELSLDTLRKMAAGGIYDHLGGGFARYSVDGRWHVPHFEKMLYDNAQLAAVYADAYLATGEAGFAAVARETLDYVLRDMTHPEGGFFSAEDADSLPRAEAAEKTEGAFYVWEKAEIDAALPKVQAALFCEAYGVEAGGNVAEDPRGEFPGKNVLFRQRDDARLSARFGVPPEEVAASLAEARKTLFALRALRPRPHLDDKVLASWNGLMITAFARAARAFDEPRYLTAALRAATFAEKHLMVRRPAEGRDPGVDSMYRRWREGEASVPAMADDLAFLSQGFLDLYEASLDVRWLAGARALAERLRRDFQDPATGDLFMTRAGHDPLVPLRARDDGDNVEPAALSVAALTWGRLAEYLNDDVLRDAAKRALSAHANTMAAEPRRFPYLLSALLFHARPPAHVVVAGDPAAPATRALWREVNKRFLPFALLIPADGGAAQAFFAERLPSLSAMKPLNGAPAAYVCRDFACQTPATDPAALGRQLDA